MGCNADRGLSVGEAHKRLAAFGPNALQQSSIPSRWTSFLRQFRDVQVYLLLAATGVSLVVWSYEGAMGPPYESIAIFCIVLLNATFGFVQDERAGRAIEA